jgi:hypothetical protein
MLISSIHGKMRNYRVFNSICFCRTSRNCDDQLVQFAIYHALLVQFAVYHALLVQFALMTSTYLVQFRGGSSNRAS